MAPKPLPPLSRALTVLRSALGWSQVELAKALGMHSSVLSDYERGPRTLTREKLNELVRPLELPAETVDWAISLVRSLHAAAQAPGDPEPSSEVESQHLHAVAEEAGRLTNEFIRSLLRRITVQGRALNDRQQAPVLWRVLQRRSPPERRVLVEDSQEYRSWALCELLGAESVKAAADHAGNAIELAELAVLIADLAPGEQAWRWRLQGYAWAHLGNARRVGGNLPAAAEAFARAGRLWQDGAPGDPGLLPEAQMLSLEASLRITQGRLAEAASLLDRALAADPGELRTNLLIQRGRLLEWAGDYEAALAMLRQAAPTGAERLDPRQRFMLRINPALLLCHLGRFEEAEALLPETRSLTAQLGNGLDAVHLRWLEGRIASGLGRTEEALGALSQVRNRFADLGIAYDAAVATLELAALYLERERTREVKMLARQLAPIFRAQGVHREALAALTLFCEAAEKEAATVALVRQVVEYLYRAQHNPELRFEPAE